MKKAAVIFALMLSASLLFSCKNTIQTAPAAQSVNAETVDYIEREKTTGGSDQLVDPTDDSKTASGDFTVVFSDGSKIEPSNGVYTLTSEGEYTLSGNLQNGSVTVDADENASVKLKLNGVSITSSSAAPIYAKTAADVDIETADGTYNTVTDGRAQTEEADGETDTNAAIYAECDLKISGSGTLIVTSEHDNGIKTKDDLTIKNVTLKVTAVGNALKGNDSVSIKSGNIILISKSSDGIKTKNTDVSAKGVQRGTVSIEGGKTDIYAACDGIDAAYNVNVSGTEECILNIYTADYSDYSGEAEASSELYLIVPRSTYSNSNDYYALFYNDDKTSGKWVKCTYETMVTSGRTQYYGLVTKAPSGYENILFNIVKSGQTPDNETFVAASSGEKINTVMNGYLITSVSSSKITGDWVTLTKGSSNSSKTTYSSKGIKAGNEINISGGTVTVKCKDDGLHANADASFDSGAKAVGGVNVSGGSITINAADDGIHADGELTVSGGYVNVAEAYEGLEGNVINMIGGTVFVYANDDGLNAYKGSQAAMINIYGGYLDITTASGDTDGIDSNGSIYMTGGFVIVKGGAQMGGVAGSIDVDGSITVTGGAVVAFGGVCETPGSGSVNTYISGSTSFSAGSYTVTDQSGETVLTFSLPSSYSSCWIASDAIELNGTYKLLRDGTEVLNWTQTSQTVGKSNGGGFNPGGPGGGPGGPGGRPR